MKPQPQPGTERGDLEHDLDQLPDLVSRALFSWRKATADRERKLAVTYLKYRGDGEKRTVNEIEAMVDKDDECYQSKLNEAVCEAEYTRLLEKLYAAKRLASLRTAY